MQKSGFQLTNEELRYLSDDEFLPAKRRLMEKLAADLLATGEELLKEPLLIAWLKSLNAPAQCKVYKGENLKDLPYLVLDLPQISAEREINLLRVVIWWGKYASISFILSGQEWQKRKSLQAPGFLYNVMDVWENDLEADVWKTHPAPESKACRIAVKVPLTDLDSLGTVAINLGQVVLGV